MNNINEREVALYILEDIFNEKSYNNISLRKNLIKHGALSSSGKNFVTELVNGVLRNLIFIDYIINYFSNTKTVKLKPAILLILRLGVYQFFFMDKTPDYAVCDESVKLCRKRGLKGLEGFVNGVLRNINRKRGEIVFPDEAAEPFLYLSVMYSMPLWILEMWKDEYDYETIKDICKELAGRPKVTVCVNVLKTTRAALLKTLIEEGMNAEEAAHENAIHISNTQDLATSDAFKKGLFHVCDVSSLMAIDMLRLAPDARVIDVCAAPGGKSFYAAYIMKNQSRISAFDIHEHKIKLMEEAIKRLGLSIDIARKDAAVTDKSLIDSADYVIVDAPCSGLGLLKKKPDIKLSRKPEDIETLVTLQSSILNTAAGYVKKGGSLLYCTCTLSRRENIGVVDSFLQNKSFTLKDTRTILPGDYHSDGFFIALLERI